MRALELRDGGLVAQQAVLEAVALLHALLRAADEGLLGVGAMAEHDLEELDAAARRSARFRSALAFAFFADEVPKAVRDQLQRFR